MECIMSKQKRVAAVGFCCADVYENLNEWYPTGNGVDFGVHLARAGVPTPRTIACATAHCMACSA